jgi:hypothetical protein
MCNAVRRLVKRLRKASYLATSLRPSWLIRIFSSGAIPPRQLFYCDEITPSDAIAIAKYIMPYVTISQIDIGSTLIHSGPYPMVKGTRAIAKSLETNATLTELALVGQRCGTLGVIALSEALHRNQMLKKLDISYNGPIGAKAGIALGRMLAVNETLSDLNLRQSRVYTSGAVAIGKALSTNKTLQFLNMDKTCIGRKGKVAVCTAWAKHDRSRISLESAVSRKWLF